VPEGALAHALVRDLMQVRPLYYWGELLLVGSAAWLSLVLAVVLEFGSAGMWLALVAATFLFFRVSIFIHELTHRNRDELPGFHLAWNLYVGLVLLLPSVLYEGVHKDHHAKTTYGTANDPEYLRLASRPGLVASVIVLSVLAPLHLLVRFLIDPPISWCVPPFRRWLLCHGSSFCFNPFYCRQTTTAERRRLFCWEVIVLAVWLPVLAVTAAGWLPWRWLLVWYGMYTGIATLNHVRALVAHRYRSDGEPMDHVSQLRDSLDTPGAWWTALWAPLGLRWHALHHLLPRLPFHQLPEAHRRLMQQLPAESAYRQTQNPSLAHGVWQLVRPRQQ
jgi:fatty acid desaturase